MSFCDEERKNETKEEPLQNDFIGIDDGRSANNSTMFDREQLGTYGKSTETSLSTS